MSEVEPVPKRLSAVVLAAAASLAVSLPAFAASSTCFTPAEWKAAHVKLLQQELQVTALECQAVEGYPFGDKYTAFVGKFQPRLKVNAKLLQGYFHRVYGGHGDGKLDEFITHIANDVSGRSMQDMKYCADSGPGFEQALAIPTEGLEQASIDRVTDHSVIGELCGAKTASSDVPPKSVAQIPK